MRSDLLALGPDVLAELTNVGTARRAAKDFAAGKRFSFTVVDDVITAADEDVTCVLGTGPFGGWTCTCAAGQGCRHLVRAVLQWQDEHAAASSPAPPAATTGPASQPGTRPVPTSGASPAADSGDRNAGLFGPRVQAEAERLRAKGVIATVTDTGARARVRFFQPDHLAVRFLVGHDPRYAKCECGTAGCVHTALAVPLLQGPPGLSRLITISPERAPVAVPDSIWAAWRTWLSQLLDLGLPAAAELLAGVVRLASEAEAAGLAHPAAALRELAEQLELRLSHSARLSPERQLELIGEVTARLQAIEQDREQLPPPLVAGTPPTTLSTGAVRLTGLGAEYRQIGGWHELRCYLLETGSMAIRTLTVSRTDSEETRHTPASLAKLRRSGVQLIDFAAGRGLLPRSKSVGDELVLPRGRWTMAAVTALEVDSDLLEAGFALAVGGDGGIPAALGPRRPADGIAVSAVASVDSIRSDGAEVTASLRDGHGAEAILQLRPDARAEAACEKLTATLASGSVTAVAGRWRPSIGGPPVVLPTAIWWSGGVLLPQLGWVVGEPAVADGVRAGSAPVDPWESWWDDFAAALGRLLLLGARRGGAQVERALSECAAQARSLGLERCAELADRVARALSFPQQRVEPFVDACILLALRD